MRYMMLQYLHIYNDYTIFIYIIARTPHPPVSSYYPPSHITHINFRTTSHIHHHNISQHIFHIIFSQKSSHFF